MENIYYFIDGASENTCEYYVFEMERYFLLLQVRECYDKHGYNLRVQVSNALSWNDQIKFVIIFCAIRQRKGDSPRGMSVSEPYYMVEKREKLV